MSLTFYVVAVDLLLFKHHPVITLNFRDLRLKTYTHCAYKSEEGGQHVSDQGITAFDIRLAMRVEHLYESYVARGYQFANKLT